MSDYIGLLIGVSISATVLLIMYFIERSVNRGKKEVEHSLSITEKVESMRILESKRLCEECKDSISKLDSLEPFDYRYFPSATLAFPVYDDYGQFKCHELCEYRDVVNPVYYGLCGIETIREFRYPQTGRWMRLGIVKK